MDSKARAVTDVGVGSGAWFGVFIGKENRKCFEARNLWNDAGPLSFKAFEPPQDDDCREALFRGPDLGPKSFEKYLGFIRTLFGRTSKMSHAGSGRAACGMTIWILLLQFESSFASTRRDGSRRWLWRLVRCLDSQASHRSMGVTLGGCDCGHGVRTCAEPFGLGDQRQPLASRRSLPDFDFDADGKSRVVRLHLTLKMSHDRGWRAACEITLRIPWLHLEILSVARGVTAMVVWLWRLVRPFFGA